MKKLFLTPVLVGGLLCAPLAMAGQLSPTESNMVFGQNDAKFAAQPLSDKELSRITGKSPNCYALCWRQHVMGWVSSAEERAERATP